MHPAASRQDLCVLTVIERVPDSHCYGDGGKAEERALNVSGRGQGDSPGTEAL